MTGRLISRTSEGGADDDGGAIGRSRGVEITGKRDPRAGKPD
jgi:hypothetical protein